jgi:plastocyanin
VLVRRRLALAIAVAAAAVPLVVVPASGAGTLAKAKTVHVKVRDDYFSPTKVKVKKGDKVKWAWGNVNTDSHDVTLQKGPKGVKIRDFRSISGAIGITFKRKFTVPGTYNFYCTIHPDIMKMDVVVKK